MIWLIEGIINIKDIPFGIWYQVFLALYFFTTSLLIAYDQSSSLHSVRQYIIYCIIMYAICLITNHKKSYAWLLKIINIAVMICCVHLVGWGHHYTTNRIVLSTNSNPNLLGTILNLGLFVVLFQTKMSIKSLTIYFPQICLLLYNIIMTGSRKSLIVSIALIIMWSFSTSIYIKNTGNKKQKFAVLILLLCAICALWYFYNTFVIHTAVIDRMQTMGNEESNGVRIEMYKEALEIFYDKPLLGGGFDQYKFLSGRGGYSHSTYAEAIADFGFFGFVLYFVPYVLVVYHAYKLAFFENRSFCSLFVFGFCIVELFLGTVQIWFAEISHFFSWTLIFLIVQGIENESGIGSKLKDKRYRKYVKY